MCAAISPGKDLLIALVVFLIPLVLCGFVVLAGYFTSPLSQRERARLLVELLDLGLRNGQSPEQTILAVAATRDPSLGPKLRVAAKHIGRGLSFGVALTRTHGFVPPNLAAMFLAAERDGVLRQAMPIARKILGAAQSETRADLAAIAPSIVVLPFMAGLLMIFQIFIFPKFVEILSAMSVPVPVLTQVIFDNPFALLVPLFVAILIVIYLSTDIVAPFSGSVQERIRSWLPWKRTRSQRTFGMMLGALLEAGVPEANAIEHAAQSTADPKIIRQSKTVMAQLRAGMSLPEALGALSGSRELQWRIKSAAKNPNGFATSLLGWTDGLESKAFQQEQTAVHIVSSCIVVVNGCVAGLFAAAIFQALIAICNEGLLW